MALERREIEQPELPVGRRGYDQSAVDEHLRRVADEMEALRAAAAGTPEQSSAAVSEQVRAILEAAERHAAEVRAQAQETAQRARSEASGGAREQLARVSQVADALLAEVSALHADAARLREEVGRVETYLGSFGPTPVGTRAASAPDPHPDPDPDPEPAPAAEQDEELARPAAYGGGDDVEGARLVALDMALNGAPREEAERRLAESYALEDPAALLDDVYAKVAQ